MAKRSSSSRASYLPLISFVALVLSGIAWLLAFVLNQVGVGAGIVGIIDTVAKILMIIVILFVAYAYVKNKAIAYKIIYWIAAVIAILFSILLVVL